MPALKNPRWEIFAQGVANGLPAYKAYLDAGFKSSVAAASTDGPRLLRNAQVANRVRELLDHLAESMAVTRESLAAEINQGIVLAHQTDQPAAVISGAMAKAKLFGLEAPSRNLNVNLSGTFNQLTDDELRFEVASMVNELRAMKGQPPLALPAKKDDDK
jgi:hypothetical protein